VENELKMYIKNVEGYGWGLSGSRQNQQRAILNTTTRHLVK